jgi:hypothetical protein
MSVRAHDPQDRPELTEEMIASYLRVRGDGEAPDGLLAAARAQALRPAAIPRPRPLAVALAAGLAVLLLASLVLTLPSRPAPTAPTAAPTAPARELLLVTYRETPAGNEVLLRPADPMTALPIAGIEPIAISQPFQTLLSPDGRTLAVLTGMYALALEDGQPDTSTGMLRLVDLASWTIRDTPVTGLVGVQRVTWAPDSTALVWLAPTQTVPTYPTGRAYRVMRWTIGSAAPERLLDLPDPAFVPIDLGVMPGGPEIPSATLALYGEPVDAAGAYTGTPRVVTIDLDHPRVIGAADLLSARALGADDQPGVVWDLARQRLFVATVDELWVIGLPGVGVRSMSAGRAGTSAEPGPSPSASAPGAQRSDTYVWGAVSPDGARLYLAGASQIVPDDPDQPTRVLPAGLRVIDTLDGGLVAAPDASVGLVTLAPSGDPLLAASWDTGACGSADAGDGEVWLLDPGTLEARARIPDPEGACPYPLIMSTSWDGRYGYLLTTVDRPVGDQDDRGTIESELRVVDLADGRVLAQRTGSGDEPLVTLLALGGSCGGVTGCWAAYGR